MPDPSDRFRIWFRRGVFVSLLFIVIGYTYCVKVARERARERFRNEPSVGAHFTGGPGFFSYSVTAWGKDQSKVSDLLRDHLDKTYSASSFGRPTPGIRVNHFLSIQFGPDLIFDRNAAEPLAHYKHIMAFHIDGAEIDAEAMQIICDLDNLDILSLTHCNLSPDAWETLSQSENLTELRLNRSSITHDDVDKIRKALPGCRVDW